MTTPDRRAVAKPIIDFDVTKGILINGKPTEVWFVGGSGDLFHGNQVVITQAAFKALLQMWIEKVRI